MSAATPVENPIPAGHELINGRLHMRDGEGRLVPHELVPEVRKLEDQTVRKIFQFATALSDQVARFKGHTADDLATFDTLLTEKYQAKPRGGKKGNRTYTSFDGLLKVSVQVADNLVFGPELQTAKDLIDECIREWSADSNAPIRLLVDNAFNVDKEGRINRAAILKLRTVEIDDARWNRAMTAIGDSIRIIGSKQYFRFYQRPTLQAPWQAVTVDIAQAEAPAEAGGRPELQEIFE